MNFTPMNGNLAWCSKPQTDLVAADFEDGDDDISPVTNPWADDVVARLKGPAKDISARDATWLLFD